MPQPTLSPNKTDYLSFTRTHHPTLQASEPQTPFPPPLHIKIFQNLLNQALETNSSDLHLSPLSTTLRSQGTLKSSPPPPPPSL